MTVVIADDFTGKTCSAPAARTERMCEIVASRVKGERPLSLLDVGCGTGSLVFRLAGALPKADITGIDISAANIRAAESKRGDIVAEGRTHFRHADYLSFITPPLDAIVSDGVLHLIGGDTPALFGKLARDLKPGGSLVVSMPYDCTYNYAFAMLRRVLRLMRSRALDALILQVGRLLHGKEMEDEGLRERLPYMYIPPQRLAGRSLREVIAPAAGLRLIARHPMPSVSVSQLKHEVLVFERTAA